MKCRSRIAICAALISASTLSSTAAAGTESAAGGVACDALESAGTTGAGARAVRSAFSEGGRVGTASGRRNSK